MTEARAGDHGHGSGDIGIPRRGDREVLRRPCELGGVLNHPVRDIGQLRRIARRVLVDHGPAVRQHEGQISSLGVQFEVRVQLAPGAILAGGEDQEIASGRENRRTGKPPFRQRVWIVRQIPSAQIEGLGSRVIQLDPVRGVAVGIEDLPHSEGRLAAVAGHKLADDWRRRVAGPQGRSQSPRPQKGQQNRRSFHRVCHPPRRFGDRAVPGISLAPLYPPGTPNQSTIVWVAAASAGGPPEPRRIADGSANAIDHRQAAKRVPNRDVSRLGAQTPLAAATQTRAGGIRHRMPAAPGWAGESGHRQILDEGRKCP